MFSLLGAACIVDYALQLVIVKNNKHLTVNNIITDYNVKKHM